MFSRWALTLFFCNIGITVQLLKIMYDMIVCVPCGCLRKSHDSLMFMTLQRLAFSFRAGHGSPWSYEWYYEIMFFQYSVLLLLLQQLLLRVCVVVVVVHVPRSEASRTRTRTRPCCVFIASVTVALMWCACILIVSLDWNEKVLMFDVWCLMFDVCIDSVLCNVVLIKRSLWEVLSFWGFVSSGDGQT